jgi:outer membrane protein TolC
MKNFFSCIFFLAIFTTKTFAFNGQLTGQSTGKITLDDLVTSIQKKHPLYLISLIEQDIAKSKKNQNLGRFDTLFTAKREANPNAFYNGSYNDFSLEQPLENWGASWLMGYRVSSGYLADYDKNRTQQDGELRMALRLSLLRDGPIDKRRADFWKAKIDQDMADPWIKRQLLDITRLGKRAYTQLIAAELRWKMTENLLKVAQKRQFAIEKLIEFGQIAPINKIDNQRLLLNRELLLIQAQRRLEAAVIDLSFFWRDENYQPTYVTRDEIPDKFPLLKSSLQETEREAEREADIRFAQENRPEKRRIDLAKEKLLVDQRLAENSLLPNLNLGFNVAKSQGYEIYKDRPTLQSGVSIELKTPLQRREAKGAISAAEQEIKKLEQDTQFLQDRIENEIRDLWSLLKNIHAQKNLAQQQIELASQLEEAERIAFEKGSAQLLTLQLREQATFEARLYFIDLELEEGRAMADYQAAVAK